MTAQAQSHTLIDIWALAISFSSGQMAALVGGNNRRLIINAGQSLVSNTSFVGERPNSLAVASVSSLAVSTLTMPIILLRVPGEDRCAPMSFCGPLGALESSVTDRPELLVDKIGCLGRFGPVRRRHSS